MKESKTLSYLKLFIESNYSDLSLFKKACDKNINLEIYLCIKEEDLLQKLNEYKNQNITNAKELSEKLINNQPIMNSTLEIYEKATLLIQKNINNYIKYHGFKMANSAGNADDWYAEFLIKYWYNVNFYKVRWFFPEQLKKQSRVIFKPMLYKDFLYQSKAVISNEKRLKAHQAASKKGGDSLFKNSLDKEFGDSNKSPKEILASKESEDDAFKTEIRLIKNKILSIAADKYLKNDSVTSEKIKFYKKIKTVLETEDIRPSKPESKAVLILAYKAGMEDLELLNFINHLSNKLKAEWSISSARVKRQIENVSKQKQPEDCLLSFEMNKLKAYSEEDIIKANIYLKNINNLNSKHRKNKKG